MDGDTVGFFVLLLLRGGVRFMFSLTLFLVGLAWCEICRDFCGAFNVLFYGDVCYLLFFTFVYYVVDADLVYLLKCKHFVD